MSDHIAGGNVAVTVVACEAAESNSVKIRLTQGYHSVWLKGPIYRRPAFGRAVCQVKAVSLAAPTNIERESIRLTGTDGVGTSANWTIESIDALQLKQDTMIN